MKNILRKTIFGASLSLAVISVASAQDLLIGFSPNLSKTVAKKEIKPLLKFVAENVGLGERAVFFDSYNLNEICAFKVPNNKVYSHLKSKLTVNAKCIRKVLNFAKNGQANIPENAIRMPQFSNFLAQHYPSQSPIDVLIYGSPLYDDPKEIGFSMLHGHVPSDGYIVASLNISPYGSGGVRGNLSNMSFNLIAGNDNWRLSSQHGFLVERFWTLYLERIGGDLASLTSSSGVAFSNALADNLKTAHDFKLSNLDKLEMIPVRQSSAVRTLIHNREISLSPPSSEEIRAAQNIEIGISWDCKDCDLDLYARPYRGADILYFQNTNTVEGQFFKDYRQTPEISNGLETVEFTKPVDLSKLFIAINHYGGEASNELITGEIRISFNGKTYAQDFHLKSKKGGKGKGVETIFSKEKAPNNTWIIISPLKVVELQ